MQGQKAQTKVLTREEKCANSLITFRFVQEGIDSMEKQIGDEVFDIVKADNDLRKYNEALDQLWACFYDLTAEECVRLKDKLANDYDDNLKLWKFFEILNPDGCTYTADCGHWAGKAVRIPSRDEVLGLLNVKHLSQYKKMEQDGLAPQLQLTPIGLEINTLCKKFALRGQELIKKNIALESFKYDDARYAPDQIIAQNKGMKSLGYITKSEWIRFNRGVLIDIVPMKESLEADKSISNRSKGELNPAGFIVEKYFEKIKREGYMPMSFESYLMKNP